MPMGDGGHTLPNRTSAQFKLQRKDAMLAMTHAMVQRITPDYVFPMLTIALIAVVFLLVRHGRM
ncbi:MAG TPA: hypothetical protein VJS43_17100 [Candidatus Acidoferrales bacterium]|nr:hypothetical protein [Candidatus Acidoferrales bacterium]